MSLNRDQLSTLKTFADKYKRAPHEALIASPTFTNHLLKHGYVERKMQSATFNRRRKTVKRDERQHELSLNPKVIDDAIVEWRKDPTYLYRLTEKGVKAVEEARKEDHEEYQRMLHGKCEVEE